MRRITRVALALALVAPTSYASAQTFLDITTLSSGTNGSFTGTIGALIPVSGAIFVPGGGLTFNATNSTTVGGSTIDGSSPQFSYGGIYSPSAALTDRIGFTRPAGAGTASVVINFGAAVVNPVFHFANLDVAFFDFASTPGVSLTLLSGNGGGGDGLGVAGTTVSDLSPFTFLEQAATVAPTTSGSRSAYGSVRLNGSYSQVFFNVGIASAATFGDNGSFTISLAPTAVPEPSSIALVAGGLAALGALGWRRRRV